MSAVRADLDEIPSSFSEISLQTEGSLLLETMLTLVCLWFLEWPQCTKLEDISLWVYGSHVYAEGKHNCLLAVVLSFNKSLGGCNSTNSRFKILILNWAERQLGTCLYTCLKARFSGLF